MICRPRLVRDKLPQLKRNGVELEVSRETGEDAVLGNNMIAEATADTRLTRKAQHMLVYLFAAVNVHSTTCHRGVVERRTDRQVLFTVHAETTIISSTNQAPVSEL